MGNARIAKVSRFRFSGNFRFPSSRWFLFYAVSCFQVSWFLSYFHSIFAISTISTQIFSFFLWFRFRFTSSIINLLDLDNYLLIKWTLTHIGFQLFYILNCSCLANVNNNTIPYHAAFALCRLITSELRDEVVCNFGQMTLSPSSTPLSPYCHQRTS